MTDDGRLATLIGLLGIAGVAAVRGSRGVVRRGDRSPWSVDVEAILQRLILVEVNDRRIGFIAYDPDHELHCQLFHVWSTQAVPARGPPRGRAPRGRRRRLGAETGRLGIAAENWTSYYYPSSVFGTGTPDEVTFQLYDETFWGTEIGTGPEAVVRLLESRMGQAMADEAVASFRAAIVACATEAGRP